MCIGLREQRTISKEQRAGSKEMKTVKLFLFFVIISIIFIGCMLWDIEEVRGRTGNNGSGDVTVPGVDEMVWVPGGSFELGRNLGTGGGWDETPISTVTLTGFWMGKYQVTQEQYLDVMGTNPSYFTIANGRHPMTGEAAMRRPVETVSWYDAIVFCNKLSIREGLAPAYEMESVDTPGQWTTDPERWGAVPTSWNYNPRWDDVKVVEGSAGYRLPTEAQWEYAAKGGNGSPGSFTYSGSNDANAVAWYWENSGSMTHEVGKKAPNGLGIYDMSGNVWEWCWNWWENYTSAPKNNPVGASSGSYRVIRGGSWLNSVGLVRSALRYVNDPCDRGSVFGFRLLRP